MARFFFHVNNGADVPDETGTVLNGTEEARQEVLLTGSELLRGTQTNFGEAAVTGQCG
jgi:hypothetical protein